MNSRIKTVGRKNTLNTGNIIFFLSENCFWYLTDLKLKRIRACIDPKTESLLLTGDRGSHD
jgi:hypothetical protein